FEWKDRKCCCMIQSEYNETTFVISEEPIIDEDKKKCNNRKDNGAANIRCVVHVLEDKEAEFNKRRGEAAN
ncbi:45_t:CDS:1, partial [Dentiscutata erythropus]